MAANRDCSVIDLFNSENHTNESLTQLAVSLMTGCFVLGMNGAPGRHCSPRNCCCSIWYTASPSRPIFSEQYIYSVMCEKHSLPCTMYIPQISYEVARYRFAYTCPLYEMVIASMGFSKRKFPKYY